MRNGANVGDIIMKVKTSRFFILKNFLVVLLFSTFIGRFCTADDFSSMTAEDCLKKAQRVLEQFDQSLSLNERKVLKETPLSEKYFLSPDLHLALETRAKLKGERDLWTQTVDLKKAFLDLDPKEKGSQNEADQMARIVTRSFEDQRKKYGMIRPAVLHNILINTGLKKEGFCWHWARDLLQQLQTLDLRYYTIQWATAHEGKLREHNSLVVIPRGGRFEEGLILDGWRKSGKSYWCRVNKDHYPWKPGEYVGE